MSLASRGGRVTIGGLDTPPLVKGEKGKVLDPQSVKRMVRRVVYRTLGISGTATPSPTRTLVCEADVRGVPAGGTLTVPQGALITPLARQAAMDQRVVLERVLDPPLLEETESAPLETAPKGQRTVALGADHGGFEMKENVKTYLSERGYRIVDCGTHSTQSVDYPDFAFAVARLVAQGTAWSGIVIDGAGIGSCMAANKVPGVRAAMCYDQATAVNSREHNDANVLTLGAGMIGINLARQIVKAWLETPVGAERHVRRVNKIMDIERRFFAEPGSGG